MKKVDQAKRAVSIFTEQMNVSNPVLTEMSDLMTMQSDLLDDMMVIDGMMGGNLRITPSIEDRSQRYEYLSPEELENMKKTKLSEMDAVEAEKEKVQEHLKIIGETYREQMRQLLAE